MEGRGAFVSIRRSSLLFLLTGSFALGTLLSNIVTHGRRRLQRYIDSRHSNGGRRPVFVVFGDSITQGGYDPTYIGWVGRLENYYMRKIDVLNRGFSGYTTEWLKQMLPDLFSRLFRRRPPALVTIWLGANDAAILPSQQHVPLEQYKENLATIIHFFRRLSHRHREVAILVISPPPLHEKDWEAFLKGMSGEPLDRLHAVSRAYSEAAVEVAKAEKVPCVDMYTVLEGPKGEDVYRKYLHDGLHLSVEGNLKAFEAIVDAIKNNYPSLDPICMEQQGPEWNELAASEPLIPLYSSKSSILSLGAGADVE